jgi:nucleoside 2-deoxyribosyltransferase
VRYFLLLFSLVAPPLGVEANAQTSIDDFIHPQANYSCVYLAGPVFTPSERGEMEEIAHVLEKKQLTTYVPHRDGFLLTDIVPFIMETGIPEHVALEWASQAVDALDVYQVFVGCGSLVFNANGRVPDEGGVVELAMAWTLGKPTVIFKSDPRSMLKGISNPLLTGRSEFHEVEDMNDIAAALWTSFSTLNVQPRMKFYPTEHVRKRIEKGERIWDLVRDLRWGAGVGFDTTTANRHLARLIIDLYRPCADILGEKGSQ